MNEELNALADLLHDCGWTSPNDAQWTRLYAAIPDIRELLSTPPAAVAVPEGDGWVPVSERLPEDGVSFLAALECGGEQTICTMRLPVLLAKNAQPCGDFIRERVTHWMPLPPAPSVDGEG